MDIEEKYVGEKLILKVKGRLDSVTAPQMEEVVSRILESTEELVVDFAELEYISSAGLRVLLNVHKKMEMKEGRMAVTGAGQEVREVFVITGFSEILHME
ncbi:MAG: STAS domain-containing protein [Lachnospiraceae bacterium]|nr:STAS domain-containing protein [Lachnospiraceae bacterium]